MIKYIENISSFNQVVNNTIPFPKDTEDYSSILKFYGLEFKKVDYYLQVGELKTVQGWILHLSVVISKIPDLLESVVPFLTEGNIPFKIVMDKQTARNLLTGYLGAPQVGKLVSIYPHNDKAAVDIAKHLIDISVSFVGPNIPTDAHLGSIVYTRYGSFNAIMKKDEYGKNSKYIYNSSGILIKDSYSIPFHLPTGIKWPFNDIKRFIPLTKAKIINHFYKPTLVLKEDSRGNVYKGIYAKGIFNTADCVIKKGNKYMCSEESGRDVSDRLKWQYELHKHLSPHVPLPKSIDFFSVDGDTYFVMEFIKGVSLNDLLSKIIFNSKCWKQLDEKESQGLLEYLIQIVDIIGQFHTKGFIHRDIQPANFLITSKKEIYLIDIELAYCVESRNPTPPFELGTPGFMSPEQKQVRIPTVKEDIYGLGALMICFFTGLSPLKFDVKQFENLSTKLNYFINNSSIANLVTSCVHPNPELRPSLIDIASNIKKYSTNLTHERNKNTLTAPSPKRSNKELNKIIIAALNGLSISPIVQLENIWYSRMVKSENQGTPQQKEYTRYSGIHEGISGVLYLLARAKRMGFNITSCLKNYNKSWDFIETTHLNQLSIQNVGIYDGSAGVALALYEGILSGLVSNDDITRNKILKCIERPSNSSIDVFSGIAGQGIAILRCSSIIGQTDSDDIVKKYVDKILALQLDDGSWNCSGYRKIGAKSISFAAGIPGIIWFLLEYSRIYKDLTTRNAAIKGLTWLSNRTKDLRSLFSNKEYNRIVPDDIEIGDERIGAMLTFIKAYEILKDPYFKKATEDILREYPKYVVNNNFSQKNGLAGLGEVYLEAYITFENSEWSDKANWIADIFMATSIQSQSDACYWSMEESGPPTADLMVGISGIIHFLLRVVAPKAIGLRILN